MGCKTGCKTGCKGIGMFSQITFKLAYEYPPGSPYRFFTIVKWGGQKWRKLHRNKCPGPFYSSNENRMADYVIRLNREQ